MRLDAETLAKAVTAALITFGPDHPLTGALTMAMADPDDLDDVLAALADLAPEHRRMFAAALHHEMMPRR